MNELSWLVGHHFEGIAKREFDWLLVLDRDTTISIGCLWRLVEECRIRVTSSDHGHFFGHSAPVDAAAEINRRLLGTTVEGVELLNGTLDFSLRFNTSHEFQIVPDSAGYEAWQVDSKDRCFIAGGGGNLTILRNRESR